MDTKIIEHFQSNWRFWISILYFTTLIVVIAVVYNKHSTKAVPPAPIITPAPTVDLDPINKRIAALEHELANQSLMNKTLKAEYDALLTHNQKLERRTQSHLEAIKRMCEYIVVITVDKKIIPRQCLPEYRWSTTEGN
jgi:hypothetical protein